MESTYFWNSALPHPERAQELEKIDRSVAQYAYDGTVNDSYVPLSYTCRASDLEHLLPILKVVISAVYSVDVAEITTYRVDGGHQIVPYTRGGNRVWIAPEQLQRLPIAEWSGKRLLSTSGLARYFVEKMVAEGRYPELPVTYYPLPKLSGEYLTLIDLGSEQIDLGTGLGSDLDADLQAAVSQGYFSYPFSVHTLGTAETVREVCALWDIQIVSDADPSVWTLQTSHHFGRPAAEWLARAVERASQGEYPVSTISISFEFSEEYTRLWGWDYKDVALKYAAYLSLSQLALTDPLVTWRAGEIRINPDLSLNVSLPSWTLLERFERYLVDALDRGISGGQHLQGVWNLEPCPNLFEGVVKRWAVQQFDSEAYPMLITSLRGNNVLIHRSQKSIQYGADQLVRASETVKAALLTELQTYYSVCHDDIEAVALEPISEMSLEQLLELVPVVEGDKTYCFLAETIGQLERLENPLTRQPLSATALAKYEHLEAGLRGLFTVGPLWGVLDVSGVLHDQLQLRTIPGTVSVIRQSVPESARDLLGNIFRVSVTFPEGKVESSEIEGSEVELFRISLPLIELERISQLREAVEQLWPTGFFLNAWNRAVWNYTDLTSVQIVDPILLNAADSLYDGNIAFNYLVKAL